MNSSIVIDSISEAWIRTRSLLLSGFDPGRWLKYGFVSMLGSAVVAQTGVFGHTPPVGTPGMGFGGDGELGDLGAPGPEAIGYLFGALQWIGENLVPLLLIGVGLLIIWLILLLVFLYIKSVFRFIFVECVAADREPFIGDGWYRHSARGLALLVWYIVVGLLPAALLVIAAGPMIAGIALIATGEAMPIGLGIGTMLAVMSVVVVGVLLLVLIQALTEDLLVPAMYARRCGVIEGWRHVARAWEGQFWNVVLFYVMKFVLGIGAGIIGGIVGLFSMLLLILPVVTLVALGGIVAISGVDPRWALISASGPALMIVLLGGAAYGYVLQVLLLPIAVFFQAYALSFLGRLDPALRTI